MVCLWRCTRCTTHHRALLVSAHTDCSWCALADKADSESEPASVARYLRIKPLRLRPYSVAAKIAAYTAFSGNPPLCTPLYFAKLQFSEIVDNAISIAQTPSPVKPGTPSGPCVAGIGCGYGAYTVRTQCVHSYRSGCSCDKDLPRAGFIPAYSRCLLHFKLDGGRQRLMDVAMRR